MAIKDKENTAELLVESFIDEETELIKSIKNSGIFKEVFYINQADAWSEINKLDKDSSVIEVFDAAKSAVRFWSSHFQYFNHISQRYSEINIWDDHFTLGVALAYLKIPYHYFEDSPGCNYRRNIFIQLSEDRITNKAYAAVTKQFGLRGNYPYAVAYHYDFSLNPMERREKDRDFSLVKELGNLKETNPDDFETIKYIFAPAGYFINYSEEKHNGEQGNFLLIGQHYSDSTYKNTHTIKYVLSLLVDYFGENMNLWIKNHPANYFNPMQAWFPDANFIVDQVPMELMVADDILHFDRVASISSSAPLVMQSSGTEVILFQNINDGDSFEAQKRFLDLNRYYIVAKLMEKIRADYGMDSLYSYEVEELSFQYLLKYQALDVPGMKKLEDIDDIKSLEQESDGIRCFFIDRIRNACEEEQKLRGKISEWLLSRSEKDVVFFANSDGNHLFFDFEQHEVMEFLHPLPFDLIDSQGNSGLFGYGNPKYPLKNTIGKLHQESYGRYGNTERQIIYMYTKDSNIAKLVLSYSVEKNLQHCGIELKYDPTAMNYRELVFESMLEQLEDQYIELQEENSLLRKQISEIQDDCSNQEVMAEHIVKKILNDIDFQNNNSTHDGEQAVMETVNATSAMLMNRMTDIDEHLIKFLTWYGFKKRIKEKIESIFGSKGKENI